MEAVVASIGVSVGLWARGRSCGEVHVPQPLRKRTAAAGEGDVQISPRPRCLSLLTSQSPLSYRARLDLEGSLRPKQKCPSTRRCATTSTRPVRWVRCSRSPRMRSLKLSVNCCAHRSSGHALGPWLVSLSARAPKHMSTLVKAICGGRSHTPTGRNTSSGQNALRRGSAFCDDALLGGTFLLLYEDRNFAQTPQVRF